MSTSPPSRALPALALALATAWSAAGCASQPRGLPGPGEARGSVPDLRGTRVLVLPVQLRQGVPAGVTVDEELAFALRSRGETVGWVFPPEMEEALRRSPGMPARLVDLPVGMFLQAEVKRIGDPLYGEIRRLGALAGADVALIPIELRYDQEGAYRLTAALVSVLTGRVPWLGVVEGAEGGAEEPGTLASLADALALAVVPLG